MYHKTVLDNGVRIITHRMPEMQSVAVGIWIRVGGRYENLQNKGISHFLEHLLFKGSKKYSCRQIKESIEGVGGILNGFTSEELTCYLAKLPARHLPVALDVLADMVLNPLLAKEDVEKERAVILEEIKMYKDLPQSYVYELLDALLWPQQPLGMSIVGDEKTVRGISRDEILSFQKQYYSAKNIVLSACGALDHEAFSKRVKKIFGCVESSMSCEFAPVLERQTMPQLSLLEKNTEQTHLAMGFHSLPREHPLKHALGLLHVILGGNMSSRLFEEIREKRGLAYEIGTQVKRFSDTGVFLVHAGIDNQKVPSTIALILKELARVTNDLVSEDEFRRAKEFYLGQLMLALEDTMDFMLWLGESVAALDKTYTLKEIIREVKQVTRQDIRRVATTLFSQEKLNVALIGPIKDREEQIRDELNLS